ncbi:MAG: HD domain-containing protein [Clostridia bacterium]
MNNLHHPVWGKITVTQKFAEVINLPEVLSLQKKSQLGFKSISINPFLTANHNRLAHSISCMYIAEMLCDILSENIKTSPHVKHSLMLALLLHDVGHYAFSHGVEKVSIIDHEDRTTAIIRNLRSKLNNIFGFDITAYLFVLFNTNEKIILKSIPGNEYELLCMFRKFVSGSADIDKIEYLTTDNFLVLGKKYNFIDMYKYLSISYFKGEKVFAFDETAIKLIENLHYCRYHSHINMYILNNDVAFDIIFESLAGLLNFSQEEIENFTESDIKVLISSNCFNKNTEISRICNIFEGGGDNFNIKKFRTIDEFNAFHNKILAIKSDSTNVYCKKIKVRLYKKENETIYIKLKTGAVVDYTTVTTIPLDLVNTSYYILVDYTYDSVSNRYKFKKMFNV